MEDVMLDCKNEGRTGFLQKKKKKQRKYKNLCHCKY